MTIMVTLQAPAGVSVATGGASGNYYVAADGTVSVPASIVPALLGAGFSYPSSGGGGGVVTPVRKTANATLTTAETNVNADTSGGTFLLTMPTTPTDGETHVIFDVASTWGTNNLQLQASSGQTMQDPALALGNFTSSVVKGTVSGGTLTYRYDLSHTRWALV